MFDYRQYKRGYFMPPVECNDWVKKDYIDKAPIWCSVDLRDGNQALIEPMSLNEKLEFFQTLVKVGFKEIEVGFPAASETEYEFLRALIERKMIPDDVTVQVLTQAREHIIKKTFEALEGVPNAIVHVYNSTSVAQREQVFGKSKEEIKDIAIAGARLLKELAANEKGNIRFEYSPESFTGTEPEYALEICNAVIDVWQPTADKKCIINLPVTVEESMPHVYASQVEYMSKNLHDRENVIISLHPHNDRGTGVADAELGVLAGGDRVEGTLFGNGERTGNVDIITLAMNLYSHGVDPELDLSDMSSLVDVYERVTQMSVEARRPYCGQLVFAAFSGSHQDAISKGVHYREIHDPSKWTVPYLPINPEDVGRKYDSDVIRINSQSGKGGVAYVLEYNYKMDIPKLMRADLGYAVKDVSDVAHKELSPEEILNIFNKRYIKYNPEFKITSVKFSQEDGSSAEARITMEINGESETVSGRGNGRLNAVSNVLETRFNINYNLFMYKEHSLNDGADSTAIAYIGIKDNNGNEFFGAGIDSDIMRASIDALESAVNRQLEG
ncbi:MAG: 2-isopropylmalate synthase [Clostridiales bacterium]|nr:2-isopropylmalate synthase [Clostridiales bacterium]MBS5877684.1 2-isopropylmalate synthase [Clostridiales bacterium]MDU0940106.1 2-isopropylmalate synthase [Clostridiales bacterium]MDU1042515.1 2-isopropylmalate synthase [Clostridiales bacterium]MDU3490644.1 2-isopropylmalate synthase [Clostridiales bacterium]